MKIGNSLKSRKKTLTDLELFAEASGLSMPMVRKHLYEMTQCILKVVDALWVMIKERCEWFGDRLNG